MEFSRISTRDRHRALFYALPCHVALSYPALSCPDSDLSNCFRPSLPSGRTGHDRAPCRAGRLILRLEAKQIIGSVCFIRPSLGFYRYFTVTSWQFLVLHGNFTALHKTSLILRIMFEVNWNIVKYPHSADEVLVKYHEIIMTYWWSIDKVRMKYKRSFNFSTIGKLQDSSCFQCPHFN
jgi:hypothetical protein